MGDTVPVPVTSGQGELSRSAGKGFGVWPERHARFSPRITPFEGSSRGNRQNLSELGVAHAKRVVLVPRRAGFSRREKPRSGVEAILEALSQGAPVQPAAGRREHPELDLLWVAISG